MVVYEISYEIIFFFPSIFCIFVGYFLSTFSLLLFSEYGEEEVSPSSDEYCSRRSTIKKKSGFEFDFWKIFLFVMGIVGMMKELGNTLLFILHCAGYIYIYIYVLLWVCCLALKFGIFGE